MRVLGRFGDRLTVREEQILLMVAEGLTGTEIAAELFISHQTVKAHTKGIRRKLGARTAAHAVALAYHRGLITVPMLRVAA